MSISKVKINDIEYNLIASNTAYGTCPTAAATAAKVITTSSAAEWVLTPGARITIKFTYTNSASNPTFNVNGTGAKSVWYGTGLLTTANKGYAGTANRPMDFIYDGTQYVFMGWSYDANTTYTNASLGQGYGTCDTAATTTAKVVTLSSYALTTGGIVAVKFTYDVPAAATMNINSKGAKAIYYKGAAITENIIKAGDTATFIYNGTYYHLISVDQTVGKRTSSTGGEIFNNYSLNQATGAFSHAEGTYTTASGDYSHAEGHGTNAKRLSATGKGSHAEGRQTLAQGDYSHAEGDGTQATGDYAHAEGAYWEGKSLLAQGLGAHAEGLGTQAIGNGAHAQNYHTQATGAMSHAEGYQTQAHDDAAHAEGNVTNAEGKYSHAEGSNTTASGQSSHAEGGRTIASGNDAHAEGRGAEASGESAHAEGTDTTASGAASHAEGYNTTASGDNAHAEGEDTTAEGSGSHAEGFETIAEGDYSHAEGSGTHAMGDYSHVEGVGTVTDATAAHASGYYTQAGYAYQFVCGMYNDNKEDTLFEVGNGSDPEQNRYNAFEVYQDGHAEVQTVGDTNNSVVHKEYLNGMIVPEAVRSENEFIDINKKYILPSDQTNWVYQYKNEPKPGMPTFTNRVRSAADPTNLNQVLNGVGYKHNIKYGYNWDTGSIVENEYRPTDSLSLGGYSVGVMRVTNNDIIRIRQIGYDTTRGDDTILLVRANGGGCAGIRPTQLAKITDGGGHYTSIGNHQTAMLQDVEIHINNSTFGWVVEDNITEYYVVFLATNLIPPEDLIITINEEIAFTESETITGWTPINKYQDSPEYLHRIISNLELRILNLEAALEKLS